MLQRQNSVFPVVASGPMLGSNHVPRQQAFTMIELLVVIAIIAILASLLLPAVIGGLKKGDIAQAQTECRLVETAMMEYLADYGKFPGQFSPGVVGDADYHIYQE
jgi:prepilin-type N-terminal cleavage/methylation domain-containing protein